MSITNDWRKKLDEFRKGGEAAEVLAERLPLDIPWEVKPDYAPPILEWTACDETPQSFASRVRKVAQHLDVEPFIHTESYGGTPTLRANWYPICEGVTCTVTVESYNSKCKFDPRKPYRAAQYAEPHPECKAMLEELREEVSDILEGVTVCTK